MSLSWGKIKWPKQSDIELTDKIFCGKRKEKVLKRRNWFRQCKKVRHKLFLGNMCYRKIQLHLLVNDYDEIVICNQWTNQSSQRNGKSKVIENVFQPEVSKLRYSAMYKRKGDQMMLSTEKYCRWRKIDSSLLSTHHTSQCIVLYIRVKDSSIV